MTPRSVKPASGGPSPTLSRLAVHELGHAAGLCKAGLSFDEVVVSLLPFTVDGQKVNGACRPSLGAPDFTDFTGCRSRVVALLCGPFAVRTAGYTQLDNGDLSDIETARQLTGKARLSAEFGSLEQQAVDIVTERSGAIRRLAEELAMRSPPRMSVAELGELAE